MIRLNLIKDNEVTPKDANLAEKVYSPNFGSIKGKSTQLKLVPIAESIAEVLAELENIDEEMKLSGQTFY